MEAGGMAQTLQQRPRLSPEEYAAAQRQEQLEWKEEPEPLYDQEPGEEER